MSQLNRLSDLGNRLYSGQASFDFVGNKKRWYAISAAIVVLTLVALLVRPLQLGIEFRGGAEFRVSGDAVSCSVADARATAADVVGGEIRSQRIGSGDSSGIRVQTEELETQAERTEVRDALAQACGVSADDVSANQISASWGEEISSKALRGLLVFLVLVALYMAAAFREWKMSVAALVALAHDLLITAAVYALVGFEVTPGTVIGILTILGYSLYDTVVVFDKVRENTAGIQGGSRTTYSEAANLAVNQTLVRSLNTSIIALLPVGGILFVGAGLLGAGALKDIALALFVGIAAGTYSSVVLATPLLADLKEREPGMQALARRVAARRASAASASGSAARQRRGSTAILERGTTAGSGGPAAEADGEVDADDAVAGSSAPPSTEPVQLRKPTGSGRQRPQPRRGGPQRPGKRR